MRVEIWVAALASTALHASLIILAPASVAPRDSAALVAAVPPVITARLKNTLASGKAARAARSPATQHSVRGRPVHVANDVKRALRVDNSLRFYPPEAVARGLEGEAILMLRIGADGALLDAQIAKSSGHAILDEAALRAIRATPRFASGPREMFFPVTFALH